MKNIFILFVVSLCCFACQESNTPITPEWVACDFIEGLAIDDAYQCGQLEVPEDHDQPDGKKITISYVVLKAKNPESDAFPMVYLTGGPGGSAIDGEGISEFWVKSPILETRDIILFDQRGIGYSSALPNIYEELYAIFAKDTDVEGEQQLMDELISDYTAKSKAANTQLQHYNTFQNAKDIGALMDYLGYEKYNVLGGSYGTRLGRVVQELFPEKLNAVIHNSPNPLQGDFLIDRLKSYHLSLERVIAYCKQDSACNAAYPDLKGDYLRAIRQLQAEPLTIDMDGEPFVLNAHEGIFFIRRQLYRNDSREKVPMLIQEYLNGGGPIIKGLAKNEFDDWYNFAMWMAVERNEMYDPNNTADVIDKVYEDLPLLPIKLGFFNAAYLAMDALHDANMTDEEKIFQDSDVPTLIMVNQFDPVTPPENGHIMMKGLHKGQLYILDEGGHGGGNPECRNKIMAAFMDNPDAELDTSCLNIYEGS